MQQTTLSCALQHLKMLQLCDTFSLLASMVMIGWAFWLITHTAERTSLLATTSLPIGSIIGICISQYALPSNTRIPTIFAVLGSSALAYKLPRSWYTAILLCISSGMWRTQTSQDAHQAMTAFFTTHTPSVHAIVTASESWHNHRNGRKITLETTHIGKQKLVTTLQYNLYTATRLQVGDYISLQRTESTAKRSVDVGLLRYAWRTQTAATFFTPTLRYKLLARPHSSMYVTAWFDQLRSSTYEHLRSILPAPVFTYCGSLFFGNKDHPDAFAVKSLFSRWGLAHYLARSGLHITIIIMLWSSMLLCLPLPIRIKYSALLLLLFLYSMLSWTSISYQRAVWLFVLFCGAQFSSRRAHTLHLLSLVTTVTLCFNPAHLFFIDFQLSFFLTFILILAIRYWLK